MDALTHAVLHRPAERSKDGDGQREQTSIDFVVNGASLLQELVRRSGGHADFMGPLAKGLPQFLDEAIAKLSGAASPDTQTGRTILYSCPECGDIGCGAYTAVIERIGDTCVWRSFAYENGYEPATVVEGMGPFSFQWREYDEAIRTAANAL